MILVLCKLKENSHLVRSVLAAIKVQVLTQNTLKLRMSYRDLTSGFSLITISFKQDKCDTCKPLMKLDELRLKVYRYFELL